MNLEEFRKKSQSESDWAPGWDEIDIAFSKLYPNQKPIHYGTDFEKRAILGGDQYLDGYSIYQSPKGYKHIVTYGMTELYADEEKLDGEWNKWGYEMTIKLAVEENDSVLWSLNLLANLARYTYTQDRFFEPFQFISGGGNSICASRSSEITALMVIRDTELDIIEGIYGKTEFLQLVGITESELSELKKNRENSKLLYDLIKKDNPDFDTDLNRLKSYL